MPAEYNPAFGAVVKEIVGDRSLRDTVMGTTVSYVTVSEMLRGKLPQRDTLIRFADGISLTGELRRRLFREAGYLDPADDVAQVA